MITNLFSVFDPSSRIGPRFNWISMGLGIYIFPIVKWRASSRLTLLVDYIFKLLYKEVKPIFSLKGKVTSVVFISLFIFILWNNLIGLVPYIFTPTSHLIVTLRLALPLWLGYYTYGWVRNLKRILAHLIPQGTPVLLIPFIVVIESVRGLIRPGTLSVRLIANIIAGHLLLTLVRRAASALAMWSLRLIVIFQLLLVVLEVAVAAIQSYVFVVLRILYSREV